jgi:hypothetical protein
MTEDLTVCCWYWVQTRTRAKYTPEHIAIWAAMVRRNLTLPHRLAVVTHEDICIPGVEVIRPPREFDDVRIGTWGETKPQCHRRLVMFRPDAERWFGRRVVSMDLDCVIGGPLDPLFDRDEDLVLFKGTSNERPYNGSLLMLRTGSRTKVYNEFTQERAAIAGQLFCGSDQAWLAHCLGWNEATWDEADGVYWFGNKYTQECEAPPRVLFFPGRLKPWTAALFDGFTRRNYRLDEKEAA